MTDGTVGDDEAFAALGRELATVAGDVVAGWIERCVATRHPGPLDAATTAAAEEAGRRAAAEVVAALGDLAARDVDEQVTTPLSVLRHAARHATSVLNAAGATPPVRDPVDAAREPADVYDLGPVTFADVDEALAGPGLAWGAAKAHVHMRRHGVRGDAG